MRICRRFAVPHCRGSVVLAALAFLVFSRNVAVSQTGLFQETDLSSIVFYEMTSGRETTTINQANFGLKLQKLPVLQSGSYDHEGASNAEWYDLYTTDALGSYRADGNFLTVDVRMDLWDIGGNIDAIHLNWGGTEPGTDYATRITRVVYGGPITTLAQPTWTSNALGAADLRATGLGGTRQGSGSEYVERMSITLAFPDSFPTAQTNLNESITPGSPLMLNTGTPGGLQIDSLTVVSGGLLSAEVAVLDASAFGLGDLPPAPPDAVFWGDDAPRQMWDIEFDGGFSGLGSLTLFYDPALLPSGFDETSLVVYHHNGSDWELISGSVDAGANSISFLTGGFSPFVLGIPEPSSIGLLFVGAFGSLFVLRRRDRARARHAS